MPEEAYVLDLVGNIIESVRLTGTITQENKLSGNLASAYATQTSVYEGEYEVTPRVDSQELKTKHKYMTDDVTVLAIPFFEVGNPSGGSTVYIGGEIEIEQVK